VKTVVVFLDCFIMGVSNEPSSLCFVFMQCLQLLGRGGTDLDSLMAPGGWCLWLKASVNDTEVPSHSLCDAIWRDLSHTLQRETAFL